MPLRVVLFDRLEVFLEHLEPHLLLGEAAVGLVGAQLEALELVGGAVEGGGGGEEEQEDHPMAASQRLPDSIGKLASTPAVCVGLNNIQCLTLSVTKY